MSVSLIIPALNEKDCLPLLAPRIPEWVKEVILADNGSTDATAAVAETLGFRVVHEPRRGYGAAAWTGSQAATGQYLAFAAADGSDPVECLDQLIKPLQNNTTSFTLSKRLSDAGSMTIPQRWGNALACNLIYLRWGVKFQDLGPFRAMSRETFDALNMTDRGFGWTMEMQAKVAARGLPWQHIALPYSVRSAGKPKISGTISGTLKASRAILWTFTRLALKHHI